MVDTVRPGPRVVMLAESHGPDSTAISITARNASSGDVRAIAFRTRSTSRAAGTSGGPPEADAGISSKFPDSP